MTPLQPRVLLVIDDDDVDRERILRWFGRQYAVVQADTADAGLELARSLQPACILLDHQLGKDSGLDLLSTFSRIGSQVIFLTGRGDEKIAARAIRGGAREYLVKGSLEREELESAVERSVEYAMAVQRMNDSEQDVERLLATATERTAPQVDTSIARCKRALADLQEPRDGNKREAALAVVDTELEVLSETFNVLLSLARAGSALPAEPVPLTDLARDIVRALPPRDGLKISCEGLPAIVGSADKLGNMLEVILKHSMEQGGRQLSRIDVSGREETGGVHLTVRDNGRAFGPSLKSAMIEQGGDGRSELGLTMARRVARSHRGELWVESELGVGTTVHVYLPGE